MASFAQKTAGYGYVPKPIRTVSVVAPGVAASQAQAAAQAQAQAQRNTQMVTLDRQRIQHMKQIQAQHRLLSLAHQQAIALFLKMHGGG